MSDDIKVLAASGDDTVAPPVATDLVSGKHYQKVKVGFGVDGVWTEAADTSGARVPVTDPAHVAATAVDAGAEATTDEAIAAAAAGTRLIGFSARETTGSAVAVFNLRHGTSNAGALLVSVSLGKSESAREWYGPDGLAAASGIWLERVSGTTSVVGYYKVVA